MPTSTGNYPVVEFDSAESVVPPPPNQRPVSSPSRRLPGWAIALLVVLGAILLIVVLAIGLVVAGGTTESDVSTSTVATTERQPAALEPADADVQPAAPVAPAPITTPTLSYTNEPLRLRGIGAIEFGMSVEQAERAVGARIVPIDEAGGANGCAFAQLEGDAAGPRFMVQFETGEFNTGTIVRADLPVGMSTRSGVGIGSTKETVLVAYADQIEVTPHKYTFAEGGEYLTFVPADGADGNYRLIMETLNDEVTAARAGLLPAVALVEGCS